MAWPDSNTVLHLILIMYESAAMLLQSITMQSTLKLKDAAIIRITMSFPQSNHLSQGVLHQDLGGGVPLGSYNGDPVYDRKIQICTPCL